MVAVLETPISVDVKTEVERLVLALPAPPTIQVRGLDKTWHTEYKTYKPQAACPECGRVCAQCAHEPGRYCGMCEDTKRLTHYVPAWLSAGDPIRPLGYRFEGTLGHHTPGVRVWMFVKVYWREAG